MSLTVFYFGLIIHDCIRKEAGVDVPWQSKKTKVEKVKKLRVYILFLLFEEKEYRDIWKLLWQ